MASLLFWSWIFTSLIRPGIALPINSDSDYDFLVRSPEFSQDSKTRTTSTAIAITVAVILIAAIAGITLTVMRNRKKKRAEDIEAGSTKPADKPTWFMVETEKVQWWRDFRRHASSTEDPEHPEGSRVERIKAALSRKKEKSILPLYGSVPSPLEAIAPSANPQPQYPDIFERGSKASSHQPSQQPPAGVQPRYKSQPRSPPKAIVTQGLSRTLIRADRRGLPKSPKAWRKSRLSRSFLPHPFLPLKDTDPPSVMAPPRSDVSRTRPTHRPSPLRFIESQFNPDDPVPTQSAPALRPLPFDMDEKPRRKIRFGSPKVRIISPAF